MKIDFRPQRLINNLVLEQKNGTQIKRIIEIPAKSANTRKTLEITYRKSHVLPTEWFVSNYNLYTNKKGQVLKKSYSVAQVSPDRRFSTVTDYGQQGFKSQLVIKRDGKDVSKSKNIYSGSQETK